MGCLFKLVCIMGRYSMWLALGAYVGYKLYWLGIDALF